VTLSLGMLAGVLIGLSITVYPGVDLQGAITLGNVVQAGTTLFVGIAVASYLQPQTASDRKEKEIVFRHFDVAIDALSTLEGSIHNGVLVDINAQLKKVSGTCSAVSNLVTELEFSAEVTSKCNVAELLSQLRRLATHTPIDATDQPAVADATVLDGRIRYSDSRAALITTRIQQTRMRLLRAQMAVNKA
jgi:hypothetical protein